jgi:hypothetical protein
MLKIEITDPEHISDYWLWLGMMEAAHFTNEKTKVHKIVGMNLMNELLQGHVCKAGERVRLQNIKLAARNGFDFDRLSLMVRNEKGRVYLEGEPLEGTEG